MSATAEQAIKPERRLPAGWRWVKLGEVCELNPRRPLIERQDDEPTSFIPMESVDAISGTAADLRNRPFCEVKKGYTYFAEGDVLFAKITPCMQNGKHAIARGLSDGIGFGSTEFHVIRPGQDICSEWIHSFVRQPAFLLRAMGHFTGAVGQQRLPQDYLASLSIPLPPSTEQQRIAGILSEQMAAVDRARVAAQARLEAVKALPATFLRQVFPKPGQPLPDGWRFVPLGDVLILRKDIVHPHDNPEGPSVFVGLEHVEPNTGRRLGSAKVELAELTGRKPMFFKDDIVYGYLRPYLNKVWVAEFDGLCSVDQYVYGVNSQETIPSYVAWYMRSPLFIENSPVGKTPGWLPRIRTEEVASVKIPLPPLALQQEIAQVLAEQMLSLENARAAAEAELEAISALPAALLRRAFSGEL